MSHLFATVRILHRLIDRLGIDVLRVDALALLRIGESLLEFHELGEVGSVERVRLPEVSAGIELIEPNFPGLGTLLEEQNNGLYSGALERAARAIEHRVQITALEQMLPQTHRGVVG